MSVTPLSAPSRFEALDMLRGIAAIVVIGFHAYWTREGAIPWTKGWLAVDLFFALSGFVLAHAYLDRLRADMSLATFLKVRLVRLYPLYIAGTLLGAATWWILAARTGNPPDSQLMATTLGWQILFLPVPPTHSLSGHLLYPLNGPAWTLSFELAINLLFAVTARALRPSVLAAIIACAVIWLLILGLRDHTVDVGWTWPTFWHGFARTAVPFFAGVAVYRLHLKYKAPAISAWPIAAFFLAWIFVGQWFDWKFDLITMLIVFPCLIWFAANAKKGSLTSRFGFWSGYLSYPIYALHVPLQDIYYRVFRKLFGNALPDLQVQAAAGFVVVTIIVAWFAAKFYDAPVRQYLGRRPRAAMAAAQNP